MKTQMKLVSAVAGGLLLSTAALADTLRQAYLADKPVTIEHKLNPGKATAPINFVQFGALDIKE